MYNIIMSTKSVFFKFRFGGTAPLQPLSHSVSLSHPVS